MNKFDGKLIDVCKHCGNQISRTDWCYDKHNENCCLGLYTPISERIVEKDGYIIDYNVPVFRDVPYPQKRKIMGHCGLCGHVLIETLAGDNGHDRCLKPDEAMDYMLVRRMLVEEGMEDKDGEYTLCSSCKWPMVHVKDREQGHHIDNCVNLYTKIEFSKWLDGRAKETYFRMIDYKE